VIRDHQKSRRTSAARVKKPKEKHARGIRDGTFLGEGAMFALGMAVDVRDGCDAWIAQM
jgi:hypothetical protein